jgi:hypothetical protein
VFIATAAAALIGGVLISRLSFDANVLRLLPRDVPTVQAFERFLLNFGSLDQLYVVFESEDPIAGHSDVVDAYIERLRKAPEIESVDAALFEEGKDWTYLYGLSSRGSRALHRAPSAPPRRRRADYRLRSAGAWPRSDPVAVHRTSRRPVFGGDVFVSAASHRSGGDRGDDPRR